MDAFADITVNFSRLNTENKLAFAVFASIQSNGSLAICDICRHLLSNVDAYRFELDQDCKGSFWTLMINVATGTSFKSVGTCTSPRCTHFNKGSIFQFDHFYEYILDQFNQLKPDQPEIEMHEAFVRVQSNIEKHVFGIGHVTSLPFLQVCALIGLLPLKAATFATVKRGGPASFFSNTESQLPVPEQFEILHREQSQIWGNQVTEAYLENASCELHRTANKRNRTNEGQKGLECLFEESPLFSSVCGDKKDILVVYSHRGIERCIQSLFYLNVDDKGEVELHMKTLKMNLTSRVVEEHGTIALRSFDDASVHHSYNYNL